MLFNKCILFILVCVQMSLSSDVENSTKILSRRKRYVAFPDGSSFSMAGCLAIGLIGQPAPSSAPGTYTFGLNWAIAYELPNATETFAYYLQKSLKTHKLAQRRRNRRELYDRVETVLDNMGYNGRQCILKTLCETTQRIMPRGANMLEEIFRTLFTMPMTKMLSSEPLQHSIYLSAQRLGSLLENCDAMFDCPVSLVDWAKGYYNAPAPVTDTRSYPWTLFSSTF